MKSTNARISATQPTAARLEKNDPTASKNEENESPMDASGTLSSVARATAR